MELPAGIRRITTPLPTRPGHVHSYLLPGDDGWTLVDTGLGLPDAQEVWTSGARRSRGGADLRHALPSRPRRRRRRRRGADRRARSTRASSTTRSASSSGGTTTGRSGSRTGSCTHGVPAEITEELIESGAVYRPFIRYQPNPQLVDDGDRLDGWELVAAPGHADGQLCLLAGRRSRLGRPPARTHLADGRPLAGEPARSARRLPRVARADDRARAGDRAAGPRRSDRRSGRPRAGADRAPPGAARLHRGGADGCAAHRLRALVRPVRRRLEAGLAPFRGRRDALPPRATRARGAGRTARGRRICCLYCAAQLGRRAPPSTDAPEKRGMSELL